MNLVVFIQFILCWFLPLQDMETIRQAYIEAARDESKIEAFNALLKGVTMEDSLILVGYKGASLALSAKIESGIKNKTDAFKKGVEFLEYSIQSDPANIELHFIRLSVQENSPGIVNYKGNMEEDKLYILENFDAISNAGLKQYIGDFIKQSQAFSDEEKESINL